MGDRSNNGGLLIILVIEDDPSIRESLVSLFALEGYEAVSVGNGQEALDFLLQSRIRPDVITLDLRMPVMNGWDFLERKEQIPSIRSIPVVAISAELNIRDLGQVAAIVPKPMEVETLLLALSQACGKK